MTRSVKCFPLLCLGAALTVGATPLAACDPVWLPLARPEGLSFFVAAALAETVLDTLAGRITGRTHPGFAARLDPGTTAPAGGQRVRLLRWSGSAARRSDHAVLVPWAYRSDCRPIHWAGRLDWIPAGTRGVVTGWLRPREHWLDGVPTFDVEMAWREPVWTQAEPRWARGTDEGELLTPEEFLELYGALPTVELLERAPEEADAPARRWARERPALAGRAPARTMLGHLDRVVAERAGRQAPASIREGRWLVDIELLDGRELPLPPAGKAIRGELDLRAVSSGLYSGSSTLDFAPLGFRLGSAEVMVTEDSSGVRLVLDPNVDHGNVTATVTGSADELAGTWYLTGRPARANGSIRLRRPADR